MAAALKMSYGDVMVKNQDDTPLYRTAKNLHDWYLARELKEGYMMSDSAHRAALSLVGKN